MKTIKLSHGLDINSKKRFMFVLLMISAINANHAQIIAGKDSTLIRPLQISIITPIGTNGIDSKKIINNISFNALAGVSAGVKGFEVAGLYNRTKGNMHGVQIAGFGNSVLNVIKGVQIGGILNSAKEVNGIQIGGVFNGAKNLNGSQLGFLNAADTVKGLQIGFINVAQSVDGVSAGFLSIVKDGYRTLEISANESFQGVVSLKIGLEHFYNIFSVGAGFHNNQLQYAWGGGVGYMMQINKKLNASLDYVSYQIGSTWPREKGKNNTLNKFSINTSYEVFEAFALFGGIAWNVQVSDQQDSDGYPIDLSLVDWLAYESTSKKGQRVTMYPGLVIGIRMNLIPNN